MQPISCSRIIGNQHNAVRSAALTVTAQRASTQLLQTRQQREAQAAQGSAAKDVRASAPPAGASATYVSNVNIQGIGKAELKFADASSQSQTEELLRKLAQAKGAAIR